MKKLLSMALALTLAASLASMVFAAGDTPKVYVDKSEIMFEDQEPVILGEGFTVVPARGVFEAMGANVEWKADTRMVEVTSKDSKTVIRLFIDDNNMMIFDVSGMMGTLMSGQDFSAPRKDVALDVAPQIINDRTMIPLRAISEALNATVDWDGAARAINITTADLPTSTEGIPEYSLNADKTSVEAGETVDLYINAKNIVPGMYVSGVTASINYNPASFEFVSASLMNGDQIVEGALGDFNSAFAGKDLVKTAYVTVNADAAMKADGCVMKFTFKSVDGKKGEFSISNGYYTKIGYNTSLLLESIEPKESKSSVKYNGNDLVIDTTPVVINADK